ncbi:MAG: DUF3459 domain-containing protein [Candidatus Limnocylindria bacterium]
MLPYVPLIFAGAEWAASSPFRYFTGHASSKLAAAVRRGRREEFVAFGWDADEVPDPQASATFETSRWNWEERTCEPHAGVLAWYRQLLALRRERATLRDGDREAVEVHHEPAAGWISVSRGPIGVFANLGSEQVSIEVSDEIRLAWPPDLTAERGRLVLPPDGVIVTEGST